MTNVKADHFLRPSLLTNIPLGSK